MTTSINAGASAPELHRQAMTIISEMLTKPEHWAADQAKSRKRRMRYEAKKLERRGRK